jgi:long-chain acyl-CoA synthetase
VPVKQQMMDWWGPILHEYYGATEAQGLTACEADEWLAHPGTVGQVKFGELHILDDDMQPCPAGTSGTVWFVNASEFEYFNDVERTAEAYSPDRTMSTVGDMGYVDEEGYLYLTDRASFMIVSGGVNIYPQESENLLITHPKVMDAAVFGVPNEDFGEEVKAVIQAMPGQVEGDELANELMAFCREHLAAMKCPRTIDFIDELPRLPTGKLYKRLLRDKYWEGHESRIL